MGQLFSNMRKKSKSQYIGSGYATHLKLPKTIHFLLPKVCAKYQEACMVAEKHVKEIYSHARRKTTQYIGYLSLYMYSKWKIKRALKCNKFICWLLKNFWPISYMEKFWLLRVTKTGRRYFYLCLRWPASCIGNFYLGCRKIALDFDFQYLLTIKDWFSSLVWFSLLVKLEIII